MDLSRIERALRTAPPEEPVYQRRTLDERRVASARGASESSPQRSRTARRLVALAGAATVVAFLAVLVMGMPSVVDGPAAASPTPQGALAGTWQLEAGV